MLLNTDEDTSLSSSGSDYEVEKYIRPQCVRKVINDDSADLLGNFNEEKRQEILAGTFQDREKSASDVEDYSIHRSESKLSSDEAFMEVEGNASGRDENTDDNEGCDDNGEITKKTDTNISSEQLTALLRGAKKPNRYVLYVTNLNFATTKDDLAEYFGRVGSVKSVRIPKKRSGGFAFVEMADMDSFRNGFRLHNTELQERHIRVQLSEAGKKKSANKKNIIKQKNRKLAAMRNEHKTFTKSGKYYDKSLKQEKANEMLARQRWRKKPALKP